MVETSTLLTCQGVKALEGSNPSVSADAKTNTNVLVLLHSARDEGIRKPQRCLRVEKQCCNTVSRAETT